MGNSSSRRKARPRSSNKSSVKTSVRLGGPYLPTKTIKTKIFRNGDINKQFNELYKEKCIEYIYCKIDQSKNTTSTTSNDNCNTNFENTIQNFLDEKEETDNWDNTTDEKISNPQFCPTYIEDILVLDENKWEKKKIRVIVFLIIFCLLILLFIPHGPHTKLFKPAFNSSDIMIGEDIVLPKTYNSEKLNKIIDKKNLQKNIQMGGIFILWFINFVLFIVSDVKRSKYKNFVTKPARGTYLVFGILSILFPIFSFIFQSKFFFLKISITIITITILFYNIIHLEKLDDINNYDKKAKDLKKYMKENNDNHRLIDIDNPTKKGSIITIIIINIFSILFLFYDRFQHHITKIFNEKFYKPGYFTSPYYNDLVKKNISRLTDYEHFEMMDNITGKNKRGTGGPGSPGVLTNAFDSAGSSASYGAF